MIAVRLLGSVDIRDADGRELETLLRQAKRVALLSYLVAAEPRGFHPRETLMSLFWPESTQDQARHALSQALHVLRQELGEDAIISRGEGEVALSDHAVSCDVWEFESALEEGDLDRALSMYHGPFLSGLSVRASAEIDHWVEGARDRLARSYAGTLERQAVSCIERLEPHEAVVWWRRLADHDPYRTQVTLRLMEALDAAGDRAGALEHADRHAARLREDLDAEPSPDVVALSEQLRRRPTPHAEMAADPLDRLKRALAARYTIERPCGAGGMATVYLAKDLRHNRKVALKALRPEVAAVLGSERFLREIEIAAQLQHPHVLPVYDSGEAAGLLYYVMPYVEGKSLRDKLAHDGELTVNDAVRILRDVADALAHAHENDVVHRDIKPDNVLLSGRHALVTDFGVAKAVRESSGPDELITAGVSLGTPAYMAPEQATADQEVDHRADIYAFGALAYELLTGRPPFLGTTQRMLLSAQVTDRPEPVTKYRDTVSPALEQLVMRCLEKTPADRWQSVGELLPRLEAMTTPSGGVTPITPRPLAATSAPRRRREISAVGAALVTVAVLSLLVFKGSGPLLYPARVVIAPFENRSGDPAQDEIGQWALDWISSGLKTEGILEVVPAGVSVRLSEDVRESSTPYLDLARITQSETVVTGWYYVHDDSVRFHSELLDGRTGGLLYSLNPTSGLVNSALEPIEAMRGRVLGVLARHFDPDWSGDPTLLSQPPSIEVYRETKAGLRSHVRQEYEQAIAHYRRALALDSTYFGALNGLANAYHNVRRLAEEDSLIAILDHNRDRLTPLERAGVDWQLGWIRGDLDLEYRAAREMVRLDPLGRRFDVANTALRSNRPREALEHLARRVLPSDIERQWYGFWLVQTDALHMLGDHDEELLVAREAREVHPDRAWSFLAEVIALIGLGRISDVRLLLDDYPNLALQRERNPGSVWRTAATELRAHAYDEVADEYFARAVRYYGQRIEEQPTTDWRPPLAVSLSGAGAHEEAYEITAELHRESPDSIRPLGMMGACAASLGRRNEALLISDRIANLGLDYLPSRAFYARAVISATLGEQRNAVDLLHDALSSGLAYGSFLHRSVLSIMLRDYPPFQQLMKPKG